MLPVRLVIIWELLLRLCSATALLVGLLWFCGWLLEPDPGSEPEPSDPAAVAAIIEARAMRLSPENPPSVVVSVDYSEGAAATWWPKVEPPVLAGHVAAGTLPPVAERVGPEPIVMAGPEGQGEYGGTWHRLANSVEDVGTIQWRLSYANLVRWSPEGYPIVPHLAKAWSHSEDMTRWTLTLREGVRWSDGAPFTADDLKYWYEWEVVYFETSPSVLRVGPHTGTMEQVDRLTVTFIFPVPHPFFLEMLAGTGSVGTSFTDYLTPAHYLRQYHPEIGDPDRIAAAMEVSRLRSPLAAYRRLRHHLNPAHPRLWPWIPRTASSSAPYVFVRNPYYPAVDPTGQQLPYLDRLVMDMRPSNLFGLAAASGQLSMQDRHLRYEDHVLLLREAPRQNYDVYHWYSASRSPYTLFPNLNRVIEPGDPSSGPKHRLLNQDAFRQALSLAISRRDLIEAEYNGQVEPAQIEPGPASPYHHPELYRAFTEYDPDRANALLDGLGLTRRDLEGYRTFPDGRRMTWYINATDFTSNGVAQFIVEDWAKVGIRALLRVRARALFMTEKRAHRHDFSVWTGESEFHPFIQPRSFVPTYDESSYAPGFGVWYSLGGMIGDPRSDRPNAIEPPPDHPLRLSMADLDALVTEVDENRRAELMRGILDRSARHLWHISVSAPPPQLVVVDRDLHNVPKLALYGASYHTPGNAGMETWFWRNRPDSPALVAQTEREMVTVTLGANSPDASADAGKSGSPETAAAAPPTSLALKLMLWGVGLLALGALAVRHPLIGRRLVIMVPTLAIVSLAVFIIVQMPPGDFVNTRILELELQGLQSSEQEAADLRETFNLNEPFLYRYLQWLGLPWFFTWNADDLGLLQGHLGLSMEHMQPVNNLIGDRILLTVLVSLATVLFTWAVALPIGIYSAVRPYSVSDYAVTLLGFLGMSVPSFLLAIVLMWAGHRWLGLEVSGLFSPEFATMEGWNTAKVIDLLKHVWIPVLVLGVGGTASMIRIMRANLMDELRKPYVTTARAKGVRPLRLLFKYPVRMALNPFVSGLGGLFPQLVSGGAIVALVLSLPMVGPVMLDALLVEDVYLAGSMLMVLSLLGMAGTLVSDLLLLWLDPRIRLEGGSR